jgi:hypothetical protein
VQLRKDVLHHTLKIGGATTALEGSGVYDGKDEFTLHCHGESVRGNAMVALGPGEASEGKAGVLGEDDSSLFSLRMLVMKCATDGRDRIDPILWGLKSPDIKASTSRLL